jgi:hypothetical protein
MRVRLSKESWACPDYERLIYEYTKVALAFSEIDEAYRRAKERAALDACLIRRHEQAGRTADEAWLALNAHLAAHRCGGA